MARKVFINLPVRNLMTSVDFFTKLGFSFDPHFTDEKASCMSVSEEVFVMLLVEDYYQNFTSKAIANTSTHNEVILAVSADSRAEVDEIVNTALSSGGHPSNEPMDQDSMYAWSFQDPDGHLWEVVYMDPAAMGQ